MNCSRTEKYSETAKRTFTKLRGEARGDDGNYYKVTWWQNVERADDRYYFWFADEVPPRIFVSCKAYKTSKNLYCVFMHTGQG